VPHPILKSCEALRTRSAASDSGFNRLPDRATDRFKNWGCHMPFLFIPDTTKNEIGFSGPEVMFYSRVQTFIHSNIAFEDLLI